MVFLTTARNGLRIPRDNGKGPVFLKHFFRFLKAAAAGGTALCSLWTGAETASADDGAFRLTSPDGAVQTSVAIDASGQLVYAVRFHGTEVIAPSPLGLSLAEGDLGRVTDLKELRVSAVSERFPCRGARAESRLDAQRALYCATPHSGPAFGLQIVAANSGFAWRFMIPGKGVRRVKAETACWRLPPESRVWFAERLSNWKLKTYAGEWLSAPLRDLHAVSPQGPVQTMPLVAELPDGLGYALATEAALFRYSGMRLLAGPDGSLRGCFTEADGFDIEGPIQTPWRVLLLTSTLDALVNNDLVGQLAPPPDPALFPSDDWTQGGRSVWSWWQGRNDYMVPEAEKRVIDCAAELGFEFTTLDEGWEAWANAWDTLKEICAHGRNRNVRVFIWKHSKALNLPADDFAALRGFLDKAQQAGCAGVKIDFMNSEAFATLAFDERVLREAALRRLLVNFHGCQKPSGESRTYPNEITREGVRGLELNRITAFHEKRQREKDAAAETRPHVPGGENQNIPASHNAALPFTRCVTGQADYTPLAFSRPGQTTWAHQLAMAYLVTSPLLVMAEHPQTLLTDPRLAPALPFIRELPVSWDETRVLEGSRIGELAAFARRKGDVWHIAMVNGTDGLKLVSLSPFFTGWRNVRLTQLADISGQATAFAASQRTVPGDAPLVISLEPCGGYVAKLERAE
jgi:alpha-glucosidase